MNMKKQKKNFMKKKLKIWNGSAWLFPILNSEIKEKLISLWLNGKLIESFNEDGETMYEEDEIEKDEDMELE